MNPPAGPDLLFVYGTLRAACGSGAHGRFLADAEPLGQGRLRGQLYQAGYPPGLVYPALVLTDQAFWVQGEVYRLTSQAQLNALDDYEECTYPAGSEQEYVRRRAAVIMASGEALEAWVYAYQRPLAGLRLIASGDFLQPGIDLNQAQ